ncbi:unnamed protein product [Thlaspi arvense]|uniref:MADS-box domain-containing protein n=1 Tax=Thlaspi arvense TaxID=13288 RepID=A0AAU9T6U4_THLAR|nr:unnamed protein product [Thlaspi arvense]
MRSPPSSSCSNSSSSCCSSSLAATSLANRLRTVFKKASELTTLCDIEACVIHYGPDGELQTWPKDRQKVRDLALRYSRLDDAKRRKKSVNLYGFLNKNKNKTKATNLTKKPRTTNSNQLMYPLSDHHSPDHISQLMESLLRKRSILQERRRFLEARKQTKAKLEDHKGLAPSSLNHQQTQSLNPSSLNLHQTQSLNPSKFSLVMYNHEDATLSQIPLSASNFTNFTDDYLMHQEVNGCGQNISMGYINSNNFQLPCDSNTQESVNNYGSNQLMPQELCGYDQNICMGDTTNSNNFQGPCVSNTQAVPVQESVNNCGMNELMPQELYGYDQSMCMSDTTNSHNFQHPCFSNTQDLAALPSELQESVNNFRLNDLTQRADPYGIMFGNSSFSQDLSDVFSSYDLQFDESSLLQTSTHLSTSFLSARFL